MDSPLSFLAYGEYNLTIAVSQKYQKMHFVFVKKKTVNLVVILLHQIEFILDSPLSFLDYGEYSLPLAVSQKQQKIHVVFC